MYSKEPLSACLWVLSGFLNSISKSRRQRVMCLFPDSNTTELQSRRSTPLQRRSQSIRFGRHGTGPGRIEERRFHRRR